MKSQSDPALNVAFTFFVSCLLALGFFWICLFDVIHTDATGKPVVCDVGGVYRTIDTPECQEALAGKWQRDDLFVWQGKCDPKTKICVPAKIK